MPVNEDKVSAADAVSAAAKSMGVEQEEQEEVEETRPATRKVTSSEKEEPEPSKESQELTRRTERALQLLDQLEDIKEGPALIEHLAKSIGLIQKAETPAEVKTATTKAQKIKDRVMAKLGEEYPMLADRVGDLFEEFIGEQEQKFTHEMNTRDRARYEQEIGSRVDQFTIKNKVTEAEQEELAKLITKFPPNPSVPPEEYLAYHLSHVRGNETSKVNSEKVKNNLKERPASKGMEGDESRSITRSKNLTAKEAVELAMRGESAE